MRLVSLCPSLTELVFDLGLGTSLVGVTRWCVHPHDGVAKLPKVGGTKDPRIEEIVALEPDLVLMNREENRLEDAEALQRAGISCHQSMPRTIAETAEMVISIGAALERPAEAASIAGEIEARAERVRLDSLDRPPVRFAYLIWRKPWMAVNRDTFAHALLSLAGGVNVFANEPERYPEVDLDTLGRRTPDLVLLCTEPFPFQDKHIDEIAEQTGLDRARLRIADGEYLAWHGSRTPDGIDYAAGLIESAIDRP